MRKDEAHRRLEPQLGHHGLEVMAIGAEAVQPDHGGDRVVAGFDLDHRIQRKMGWSRSGPGAAAVFAGGQSPMRYICDTMRVAGLSSRCSFGRSRKFISAVRNSITTVALPIGCSNRSST